MPDADCPYCHGTGERLWHTADCHSDYCALNGNYPSCRGQVERCPCGEPLTPSEFRKWYFNDWMPGEGD